MICFQKVQEYEILDFAKNQLTLPDKIDPSDAMSWQHHLYSKLGTKRPVLSDQLISKVPEKGNSIDEVSERIVAMAKVLYGLHMICILFSFLFPIFLLLSKR